MERDWIDSTLDRWAALQPDLAADVYQVTGRISRIAARLAQRQEEVFGRHGLNRGDVGVLSALRTSPTPKGLSPTQLMRGLMLSSTETPLVQIRPATRPPAAHPAGVSPDRLPRYLNRELSQLDFEDRILAMAQAPSLPLLERVRFLAILGESLDQFFQVRVAGLKEQL